MSSCPVYSILKSPGILESHVWCFLQHCLGMKNLFSSGSIVISMQFSYRSA